MSKMKIRNYFNRTGRKVWKVMLFMKKNFKIFSKKVDNGIIHILFLWHTH